MDIDEEAAVLEQGLHLRHNLGTPTLGVVDQNQQR
jgi:hypothetical protein